ISRIVELLELEAEDHLMDLCCGNGLVTRELACEVALVTAVDFAAHLIETARNHCGANNISYVEGDVLEEIRRVREPPPRKFLMNDALAYFSPETLGHLVDAMQEVTGGGAMRAMLTGVPDDARKWNFYDTPE